MFAKRLIQKATQHHHHHHHDHQLNEQQDTLKSADLDIQIALHYGIPSTASLLAFDNVQSIFAVGTLDGRIKVIGGDGIEGLLKSPKQLPYKYLEFLQNQGFLVGILNDNDIQVWNLESRCLACCLHWESNVTAFSVVTDSCFMYVGDDSGLTSVLKYDTEEGKLLLMPYNVPANSLTELAGIPCPDLEPVVGVIPHPCSSGCRVLIAYQNGVMILWDISEARILFIGGYNDLKLKGNALDTQGETNADPPEDLFDEHLEDKEISGLCWASSDGSILVVGYVDGDILFWNTSTVATPRSQKNGGRNIIKLQLSSAEKRLPIIVLNWSPNTKSRNNCDGQLFIYGGDEIGSEEVLTVLTVEWSSGMETVKCTGRVDLTLTASFADMILLPRAGSTKAGVFVLTNPGQIHLYDDGSLSAALSQQERKASVSAVEYPAVVPLAEPSMTVSMLTAFPTVGNASKILSEIAKTLSMPTKIGDRDWPVTGGVSCQLSAIKYQGVDRVYIAGYQDGSIKLWDATYPVFSLICTLESEVQTIKVAGSSAQVSKLDFCSSTAHLAVGNQCGQVRIYDFNVRSNEISFHFVTESKHEVYKLPQGKRPVCTAIFNLINSPIRALSFVNSGAKLAVGFEAGQVAVLNMSSSSVLFLADSVTGSCSPVVSVSWKKYALIHDLHKSSKHSQSKAPDDHSEEVVFVLTKNAKVKILNGCNGSTIIDSWQKEATAVSMYVLGKYKAPGNDDKKAIKDSSVSDNKSISGAKKEVIGSHDDENLSSKTEYSEEIFLSSLVLLCREDSLSIYSTQSVVQGNNKAIKKLKHTKPCCWTSIFNKDKNTCGLVMLFQTGAIEIRSIPDLELVEESSLMAILRWNFKANMEKSICSSNDGIIALANGSELAFISLLDSDNNFRNPESLPCLHDKVLAAAADAAISHTLNQKKKQGSGPGIIGGIVKGFKGGKMNTSDIFSSHTNPTLLEAIFSKSYFSNLPPSGVNDQIVEELDIDDIEIDEPVTQQTTLSHDVKGKNREKETDREKLLGSASDVKPRIRTREEIIAKYRKTDDATSVAAHARNKLVERGEKLERISRRTEELQSGAEDFASLAHELVKTMENRKWWQM
ncbi:hypothetical protein ACFE04_029850 [Oxalis oulophora]